MVNELIQIPSINHIIYIFFYLKLKITHGFEIQYIKSFKIIQSNIFEKKIKKNHINFIYNKKFNFVIY